MNVIVTGYADGKKIHAIKGIRAVSGLGLKEAKQVADDIDAGHQPEITLTRPEYIKELDEMGVRYELVAVGVPLADLVAVLADYPRHLTVGDLHDTLKVAEQHSKTNASRSTDA